MKKAILFLLILLPFTIHGQIKKGTFVTGGLVSGSIKNYELEKVYNFQIQPLLGYFILNNLLIGVDPVYEFNMIKDKPINSQSGKERTNSFGFAPKIGYYFNIKSINPYLQFEVASGWSKGVSQSYYYYQLREYDYTSNYNKISPIVGVLYRINSNIGLDIQLKYSWVKEHHEIEYGELNSANVITYKSNKSWEVLGVHFGLMIMFPKSEKNL